MFHRSSNQPSNQPDSTHAIRGQGLVEYAIILALVALAVIAIINVMEPAIGNVFSQFASNAPVAPPSLLSYTPPPTATHTPTTDPSASPTNTPTNTATVPPIPSETPTSTNTPTFTPTPTPTYTPTPCPYGPHNIPARIQAEDFMCGGSGVAFSDTNEGPGHNGYRTDLPPTGNVGPDLETTGDTGGGWNVGWTRNGEWIRYNIVVPTPASLYNITVRVASVNSSGRYRLYADGQAITDEIAIPNTGGYQTWESQLLNNNGAGIPLVNQTVLELRIVVGGANFNYIDITPYVPPNILFVVGDPNSLNSSEVMIRNRLEGQGHTLLIIDDGVVQANHANNKNLVIISSTVNPGTVGTKLRDVPVPVLIWERELYDEMRMTTGSNHGTANNQTQINVQNVNHPLRGSVGTGNRPVYSSNQILSWGTPNGNAVNIASQTGGNNISRRAIFAYPQGAQMIGTPAFFAPHRRVGFFLHDNSAVSLNNTGWALFDNAVNWAINGN